MAPPALTPDEYRPLANENLMPFPPQAVLLAGTLAGRYRPGRHHHHNGFLQHLFATSPWLAGIMVALLVIAGLVLTLVKKAGKVLEGTPWYVRLGLLATAGFGIFRLLNRKKHAPHQEDAWHGTDHWQPAPRDRTRLGDPSGR